MERFLEIHEELKRSMQKEVNLMRDLLANMHQEELSLLMHDRPSWNKLMEERAKIVENLGSWRSLRIAATEKLTTHYGQGKKGPTLEEILPATEESSCEILSLRDQLMALTERTNGQNYRNQNLYKQVEPHFDTPVEKVRRGSAPAPKPRRVSVITDREKAG